MEKRIVRGCAAESLPLYAGEGMDGGGLEIRRECGL